jgi:hypothetical protein
MGSDCGRRQKAEGRRQKAEGRRQKAEGSKRNSAVFVVAISFLHNLRILLPTAFCFLPSAFWPSL